MKKIILFGIFAGFVCAGAYASDGVYTETETINTYETITINTVKYYDVAPVHNVRVRPCRAASSIDLSRNCGGCATKLAAKKLAPVRVKTYTEVIDHYQVYEPVVSYKPAGTYTTRRYVQAPNPHCGTCAR